MHRYSFIHSCIYPYCPLTASPGGPENSNVCLSAGSERAMEVRPPAPRSSLCRAQGLFPRVFAAEVVAVDSVAADPEVLEDQKRPSYVPESHYLESGWDRLRELFVKE